MPVYRKGKKARVRKEGKRVIRMGGRRVYSRRQEWALESTQFGVIRFLFPLIFGAGHDVVIERYKAKGSPVVVLDWGCGKGVAANGIAQHYGPLAKVYAYSADSYPEWDTIHADESKPRPKFIHETQLGLLRYFKNGSIDLIYSYAGLTHLAGMREPTREAMNYFDGLLEKVSKGGKIVFDTELTHPNFATNFEAAFKKYFSEKASLFIEGKAVYITKK